MQTLENPPQPVKARPPAHREPAPQSSPTPTSAPRLGRWVVFVAILLVAGLAVGIIPRLHAGRELTQQSHDLAIMTVNVVSPETEKATSLLTLPAEIKPRMEAPIFARANGYLKKYYVDIGSKVAEGDLLAEIDLPELDQELRSANAELKRAEAALGLAKTTAARWDELRKTDSVSEQESAEKTADLALKSATSDASRANVARLEQLKNFSRVVAPFGGVVTARNADVGDLVSANSSRELFHIAALDKLRVFVNVPQSLASKVETGSTAELIPTELRSQKFVAKVVRTAGAIAPATRTMLTELEVDNSRGEILAGSYAQVTFNEMSREMPLVVPSNTLIYRADGAMVARVTGENKVELRPVTTGRDFGKTVEILSGVTTQDRVIINPIDAIATGQSVEIAQAAAEKAP